MMASLTFYPDKPNERRPDAISGWDESGDYICQQKVDGWRMMVILEPDGVAVVSRHNKEFTGEIEDALLEQAERLRDIFPNYTQLDCEWVSRRSCSKEYRLEPALYLLDIMRLGKKWLCGLACEERWETLKQAYQDIDGEHYLPNIHLIPEAEPGHFVEFYEAQKNIPLSEGVVIKHRRSTMNRERRQCKKNRRWFKVKYRGGVDGEVDMSLFRGKK